MGSQKTERKKKTIKFKENHNKTKKTKKKKKYARVTKPIKSDSIY